MTVKPTPSAVKPQPKLPPTHTPNAGGRGSKVESFADKKAGVAALFARNPGALTGAKPSGSLITRTVVPTPPPASAEPTEKEPATAEPIAADTASEEKAPTVTAEDSVSAVARSTFNNRTSTNNLPLLTTGRPTGKSNGSVRRPPSHVSLRNLREMRAKEPIESSPEKSEPVMTKMTFHYRLPPGYKLEIRGIGGGLDWLVSKPLTQVDTDTFIYEMKDLSQKVEYKLVLVDPKGNVCCWEKQENNHSIEPGCIEEVTPSLPSFTIMTFKCKVPFGHKIEIRGEKGNLSWIQGQPLIQISEDTFGYSMQGLAEAAKYKLVLVKPDGQLIWEDGADNHVARPGTTTEVVPSLKMPKVPVIVNYDSNEELWVRGSAPLSWIKGTKLHKSETGKYFLAVDAAEIGSFEFKILKNNDQQWSLGQENFKVENGNPVEVTPRF